DDRSQTDRHSLSLHDHHFLFHRQCGGGVDADRVAHAAGRSGDLRNVQQTLHIHGVLMVWFFLIPSIPTVLGNFILPLMIGARDVAFPKLNLMSWYIFVAGGGLALWSLLHGGVDTGWTFYTPYSTTYANTHVISMAAGVFVAGFSTII